MNELQRERRKYVRKPSLHPSWWHSLHRLWTRAVGQPNYCKSDWQQFESELNDLARKAR
jgi:hypothetical protein